ncbi:MAG: putative Fe-S cluster assembly protein SufT [Proteobacteria bacterium]|nr:putative Fe-S cluster assembly protein SufT [Pseudomonadota bacterium]TDJ13172.1 MAG: putative Fe-S cluster assembly protein SufT [Gammaproteobacteria bacterium]
MNFHNSEPITLYRDCQAVLIPAGNEVTLPQGSIGYITQSLGGSFTVYIEGNLFLIAGRDADALGKDPVPLPTLPDNAQDEDVEKVVWEQLKTCFDPEIPINVVDLGLIYNCELSKNDDGQRRVDIEMTLTAPGCGMGPMLIHDVRSKLELIPTIEQAQVELVFDPPWNQGMMSDAARLQTGMM